MRQRFSIAGPGTLCFLLAAWLGAPPARGAAPAVHALTGARLVVAPGHVVEGATLVVRDGVIEAAGPALTPPADARVTSAEGLTIYPGLIDLYVALDAPKPARGADGSEGDDEASADRVPAERSPLLHPELDATSLPFEQSRVEKLRGAGFTTALVAPGSGALRGRAAVLNLGDGTLTANLLLRDVALAAAFELDPGNAYPNSLMGSVALLRQTLLDASWYGKARAAYAKNPAQPRPPVDPMLEALQPVLARTMPVVFETTDSLDTLRAAGLLNELGLRGWLVGTGREQERLGALAASKLPLILPLDLPPDPVVGEKDDLSVGLAELRRWDRAPANPKAVADAGIPFVLTSHELSSPTKLHAHLARAIERGLGAEQALAALTVVPAQWLGIADRAGTLEAGKMANFIVVEGELFVEKPKIRQVWVDGRRYEVAESKPPEIDPAGTWEVTVAAGGNPIPVTLVVKGEVDDLSGSLSVMGQTIPLSSASVSGKTLEVVIDGTRLGMGGDITLKLNIDGDSATGTAESPQGPATLSGRRTSKPEPEALP